MYEDNQGCIALAKNLVYHKRTKLIDVRHHFIREKVEMGIIELRYLPTGEMVADALTKGLPAPQFKKLVGLMGMRE